MNRRFIQVGFQFIFLSQEFYCHANSFPRFSPIKMISYSLINKMGAKSLLYGLYGLIDKENLLNQLLSGQQILIIKFCSLFHILVVFL